MGNVYAFGPKDDALNRQEIVDTLKQLIEGNDNLKAFPANFKLALEMRVWESERKFAGMTEIPPCSLHAFIHEKYPYGIGATYEIVENLIRHRADVLALWVEVTKRPGGRPRVEGENVDNIHVKNQPERPTGTSAAAGLRKLQKAVAEGNEKAAEELQAVVNGDKTVHRACVDAGLRKPTKPVKLAPEPLNEFESREKWMDYMMRGWNRAPAAWREAFFERVDGTIFDETSMGQA